MSKGKLHKIIINPKNLNLKLRFSQHPSESDERVMKKFLVAYLLSDHHLRENSEVCQGGKPDLTSKHGNLCIWLEVPRSRDYNKASQEFDIRHLLKCSSMKGSLLTNEIWSIDSLGEDTYSLNGDLIKANLLTLEKLKLL